MFTLRKVVNIHYTNVNGFEDVSHFAARNDLQVDLPQEIILKIFVRTF